MSDVFANVPSEGATLEIDAALDRLSAKEDKTSSESQTENKETEKPSQEGKKTPVQDNIPFHKHPRWQKTQQELKELREETALLKADRVMGQPITVPDWWKKQYGDTPESKARYESVVQKDGELDWIKKQVLEEVENRSKTEQQTISAGEEYVSSQISEMNEEGLKFEKNSLLKFMVDFQTQFGSGALLGEDGNYDFRKSLTLMERMQPKEIDASNTVRKQVAALGGRGKGVAPQSSSIPVLSRNMLRRGNWRDADTGKFVGK